MTCDATRPRPHSQRSLLRGHEIFIRYVLFAIIAGAANLGSQAGVMHARPEGTVSLAVLIGTAIGFLTKYILDKSWIFQDDYESHKAELRKIVTYGISGVGTTLVFWSIELGAWSYWHTAEAKYAGGALGLSLGNWIKYLLDRRYVFRRRSQ